MKSDQSRSSTNLFKGKVDIENIPESNIVMDRTGELNAML